MGVEIEHKYLLKNDAYKEMCTSSIEIKQGYLSRDPKRIVRIRIAGDTAYITIKGLTLGDSRPEYEYSIPVRDAEEMLALCDPPIIRKRRYIVPFSGYKWEIDEFISPRRFIIAEIEIHDQGESYPLPSFIGENVTGIEKYYNSNIR